MKPSKIEWSLLVAVFVLTVYIINEFLTELTK